MTSRTIQRLCRFMAFAALVGALFVVAGMILSLAYAALLVQPSAMMHFDGPVMTAATPVLYRFASTLLNMVPDLFSVWLCLALYRLMRLYARGEVFEAAALREIKMIGFALLGGAVATLVFGPLSKMVMTLALPAGQHSLSLNFGNEDAVRLFQAAMVFVIARVMDEARRLADENARFI